MRDSRRWFHAGFWGFWGALAGLLVAAGGLYLVLYGLGVYPVVRDLLAAR